MTIESATLRGRAAAEARMVDACVITRPDPDAQPVFNPATGLYEPAAPLTIYEGPCEVQANDGLGARNRDIGGAELTLLRLTVKIPISAQGVLVNDDVTLTAAALDPDLVDQRFRVTAGHAKSFATARRLAVEAIAEAA